MDKVKIQRKKRDHKKATVKDKILTALGVGSAFIGMSAAGASQPKNAIVRTMNKVNPLSANKALAADAEVESEEETDAESEDVSSEQPVQPAAFYFNTAQASDTGGIRGPDVYAANNQTNLVQAEDLDLSSEQNNPSPATPPPVVAQRTVRTVRQTRAPLESDQSYTVVKGDTLWDLAVEYYGDGTKWHKILEANPGKIPGDNPRLLQIGTVLVIPKI